MVICLYSSASKGDRRQEDLFFFATEDIAKSYTIYLYPPLFRAESSLTDDLACCFRLAPLAGALDQFTGPQLTVWIPSFAQADCCLIVHFGEAKLTLLPLLGLSHCWCLRPLATVLFTELVGGLNFFCNALAASLSVVARGLAFWLNLLRSDLVFFW